MILHHLPAATRFHTQIDWLDSWHSFSFGNHYDPTRQGFRALRVINEDWVAPGAGFPRHGHRDMEIVTYVLEGALAHKDSSGGAGTIRPGDAQRMSAGRGIEHSEYNASAEARAYLLQIWLLPARTGIAPGYEEKRLPTVAPGASAIDLIAGPQGGENAVTIVQDARIQRVRLAPGQPLTHQLGAGRHAWVQVARGAATVLDQPLVQGDGLAVSEADRLSFAADAEAELLLFDLA